LAHPEEEYLVVGEGRPKDFFDRMNGMNRIMVHYPVDPRSALSACLAVQSQNQGQAPAEKRQEPVPAFARAVARPRFAAVQ
jgi:hypothetical protein